MSKEPEQNKNYQVENKISASQRADGQYELAATVLPGGLRSQMEEKVSGGKSMFRQVIRDGSGQEVGVTEWVETKDAAFDATAVIVSTHLLSTSPETEDSEPEL